MKQVNYKSSGVDIDLGDKASKDAFRQLQKTFNMGLGMIGIVRKEEVPEITKYLKTKKEKFYLIGTIKKEK